jgi:hypothetical protein
MNDGKQLLLVPDGWPVRLGDCRSGLFVHGDSVCMLSDYNAYDSEGAFWAPEDRDELIVQPVRAVWLGRGVTVEGGEEGRCVAPKSPG